MITCSRLKFDRIEWIRADAEMKKGKINGKICWPHTVTISVINSFGLNTSVSIIIQESFLSF